MTIVSTTSTFDLADLPWPATSVTVDGETSVEVDDSVTAAQLTTAIQAAAGIQAQRAADAQARDAKRTTVGNAVATLRQWADDAEATTATSGNAVAVLNTVVDRLGVFFDRFADLIEAQRLDQ